MKISQGLKTPYFLITVKRKNHTQEFDILSFPAGVYGPTGCGYSSFPTEKSWQSLSFLGSSEY